LGGARLRRRLHRSFEGTEIIFEGQYRGVKFSLCFLKMR
jgi:hypothetical protein